MGSKVARLCQRFEAEPAYIAHLIDSVVLDRKRIEMRLAEDVIAATIGRQVDELTPGLASFDHAITLKRRGVEIRIFAGAFQRAPDPLLIRALAKAWACAKALRSGTSLTALVAKTGHFEPYLRAKLPLAFLSPKLQTAIMGALLHRLTDGQDFPFCGRRYSLASLTGMPRAVKPFRTATRIWNSST